MNRNVYLYILVMAGVTYLIRLLPLTLIKKEIKNVYIKSFLYYVPYVTLSVMTFPGHVSYYRDNPPLARALLSRMDWTTGTMKIATMPPAYPLLYRFIPPYTIPTFSATDE